MSLLGIDIGTTGCKAAAFSIDGSLITSAYREYGSIYPREGWVELDAREVFKKVKETVAEVTPQTSADPITAMSFSSLGEAMTPVTADREILANSILMTDLRGGDYVDKLRSDIGQEAFYETNPNILGTNYSLPKILWLKDERPDVYERTDNLLLYADLIAFLFGGEALSNHSLSNRTLLYDIRKEDWSDDLVRWSGLDADKLPKTTHSGVVSGTILPEIARELGLSPNVKIVVGGHDQCCNALGAGIDHGGKAVCGMGTFQCITPVYDSIPESGPMLEGGLNIEHHVVQGNYVSFIFNQSGTLVRWFRDTFAKGDQKLHSESDIYDLLTSEMPSDPTKLLVLPHFEFTGPPHFIPDSAGVIAGLRVNTPRGEVLKAIMEGVSFYFVESLNTLNNLGIDLSELIATGGGAKSDAWLQIQADVFGIPFVRPKISECSILGAAILAGVGTGVYNSPGEGVSQFVDVDRTFEPDKKRHEVYQEVYAKYSQIYPALKNLLKTL